LKEGRRCRHRMPSLSAAARQARRLARRRRAARRHRHRSFGGTCINTGCTPTKTKVVIAYAAHMARRAAEFGVVVGGGVSVDMPRVMQRKDDIVASWSAATEASLRATENCTVIEGSHLLLAVGRWPSTDDLGLDRAGVTVDARGTITVDEQLRTNVAGIWALGDCNGCGAFTHTAYNDFEIVAANLLDGETRTVNDRIAA
jgi:pyruvate/2-oxoglutarate dehydrogenase complex dihydrolipoamide dehydrogenase (E3) component